MPNKESAKKRMRRDAIVKIENRSKIRTLKTTLKKCALEASDEVLMERMRKAQSLLDKSARRKLISRQRSGRLVSRLMKQRSQANA